MKNLEYPPGTNGASKINNVKKLPYHQLICLILLSIIYTFSYVSMGRWVENSNIHHEIHSYSRVFIHRGQFSVYSIPQSNKSSL